MCVCKLLTESQNADWLPICVWFEAPRMRSATNTMIGGIGKLFLGYFSVCVFCFWAVLSHNLSTEREHVERAVRDARSLICWCARFCGRSRAHGDCWRPIRLPNAVRRTCCECTDYDGTSSGAPGNGSRRTASSDQLGR